MHYQSIVKPHTISQTHTKISHLPLSHPLREATPPPITNSTASPPSKSPNLAKLHPSPNIQPPPSTSPFLISYLHHLPPSNHPSIHLNSLSPHPHLSPNKRQKKSIQPNNLSLNRPPKQPPSHPVPQKTSTRKIYLLPMTPRSYRYPLPRTFAYLISPFKKPSQPASQPAFSPPPPPPPPLANK